jgi:hypothetical protein
MRELSLLFMVIIALAAVACASKESIETIERMGPQVEQALNGQSTR